MIVGVGIPCHINDVNLLRKYCLPAILSLNPSPDYVVIDINKGYSEDGKKNINAVKISRTKLFNIIFDDLECDVALMISADHFIISKNIINYINKDIVTNFGLITNRPISSIFFILIRLISSNPWNACFSIPRKTWYEIKNKWLSGDGSDTIIHLAVKNNYHVIRFPKYMLMNRNKKALKIMSLYHPHNIKKNIIKKMFLLCKGLEI